MKYEIRKKRGAKMLSTVKRSHPGYDRVKLTRRNPTPVAEIEKLLGLDKVDPIVLTSSEAKDNFDQDREYFKDMYEDELKKLYNEI